MDSVLIYMGAPLCLCHRQVVCAWHFEMISALLRFDKVHLYVSRTHKTKVLKCPYPHLVPFLQNFYFFNFGNPVYATAFDE